MNIKTCFKGIVHAKINNHILCCSKSDERRNFEECFKSRVWCKGSIFILFKMICLFKSTRAVYVDTQMSFLFTHVCVCARLARVMPERSRCVGICPASPAAHLCARLCPLRANYAPDTQIDTENGRGGIETFATQALTGKKRGAAFEKLKTGWENKIKVLEKGRRRERDSWRAAHLFHVVLLLSD